MFVGGLPSDITPQEVTEYFEAFGKVCNLLHNLHSKILKTRSEFSMLSVASFYCLILFFFFIKTKKTLLSVCFVLIFGLFSNYQIIRILYDISYTRISIISKKKPYRYYFLLIFCSLIVLINVFL